MCVNTVQNSSGGSCATIPGCNYIFVLQLFFFGHQRVDDNVVDVVNTLSPTLAHKALNGRKTKTRKADMIDVAF